ncbi:hypothetical protein [Bifidobacterium platyrrhinorum]|uniref:Uncharacterized protein n=1 Tax=Bifidobacterium platyrrhinorum TaxID=2661628 RepID=A0A6L9SV75_9BIFI|nr:hypothetical protein [Bifidobacterium platyrrhinorum]NEG55452.1 hypothetical protein [Bifidobacterium platyrrhinorum]
MRDILCTVDFNERTRVNVYQDLDALQFDNPVQRYAGDIECVTIDAGFLDTSTWDTCDSSVCDVRYAALTYSQEDAVDDAVCAVRKHYARKGMASVVAEYNGPYQGCWATFVIASDKWSENELQSFVNEELRMFWDGDVYLCELEQLHEWADAVGDTMTTWETVDAMGGFYANTPDEAAALYAGEYAEVA